MKIIIDNRERALIPIIKEAIKNKNLPLEVIVDKLETWRCYYKGYSGQ